MVGNELNQRGVAEFLDNALNGVAGAAGRHLVVLSGPGGAGKTTATKLFYNARLASAESAGWAPLPVLPLEQLRIEPDRKELAPPSTPTARPSVPFWIGLRAHVGWPAELARQIDAAGLPDRTRAHWRAGRASAEELTASGRGLMATAALGAVFATPPAAAAVAATTAVNVAWSVVRSRPRPADLSRLAQDLERVSKLRAITDVVLVIEDFQDSDDELVGALRSLLWESAGHRHGLLIITTTTSMTGALEEWQQLFIDELLGAEEGPAIDTVCLFGIERDEVQGQPTAEALQWASNPGMSPRANLLNPRVLQHALLSPRPVHDHDNAVDADPFLRSLFRQLPREAQLFLARGALLGETFHRAAAAAESARAVDSQEGAWIAPVAGCTHTDSFLDAGTYQACKSEALQLLGARRVVTLVPETVLAEHWTTGTTADRTLAVQALLAQIRHKDTQLGTPQEARSLFRLAAAHLNEGNVNGALALMMEAQALPAVADTAMDQLIMTAGIGSTLSGYDVGLGRRSVAFAQAVVESAPTDQLGLLVSAADSLRRSMALPPADVLEQLLDSLSAVTERTGYSERLAETLGEWLPQETRPLAQRLRRLPAGQPIDWPVWTGGVGRPALSRREFDQRLPTIQRDPRFAEYFERIDELDHLTAADTQRAAELLASDLERLALIVNDADWKRTVGQIGLNACGHLAGILTRTATPGNFALAIAMFEQFAPLVLQTERDDDLRGAIESIPQRDAYTLAIAAVGLAGASGPSSDRLLEIGKAVCVRVADWQPLSIGTVAAPLAETALGTLGPRGDRWWQATCREIVAHLAEWPLDRDTVVQAVSSLLYLNDDPPVQRSVIEAIRLNPEARRLLTVSGTVSDRWISTQAEIRRRLR